MGATSAPMRALMKLLLQALNSPTTARRTGRARSAARSAMAATLARSLRSLAWRSRRGRSWAQSADPVGGTHAAAACSASASAHGARRACWMDRTSARSPEAARRASARDGFHPGPPLRPTVRRLGSRWRRWPSALHGGPRDRGRRSRRRGAPVPRPRRRHGRPLGAPASPRRGLLLRARTRHAIARDPARPWRRPPSARARGSAGRSGRAPAWTTGPRWRPGRRAPSREPAEGTPRGRPVPPMPAPRANAARASVGGASTESRSFFAPAASPRSKRASARRMATAGEASSTARSSHSSARAPSPWARSRSASSRRASCRASLPGSATASPRAKASRTSSRDAPVACRARARRTHTSARDGARRASSSRVSASSASR